MSVLPPVLSMLSAGSARRVGAAALTLVVGTGLALAGSSPAAAARTAHLTGTVTAAGGVPLEGIEATAWVQIEGEWEPIESVDTNAAGAYDIGALEPGTYRVGFFDVSDTYVYEFWQDAGSVLEATNIPVADGATVAVGAAVLGAYAHITGTVTNANGGPLGDIAVSAYREDAGLYPEEPSYTTYTSGADGTYDLDGMQAGTYRLEFFDEFTEYATEYWNDAASLETATDIVVAASATVTGKNAVLVRGSSITGTVTLPGGDGAFLAEVIGYRQASPGAEWKDVAYTTTDESGAYRLSNLRAGQYRVGFLYTDLAEEYWNDRPTLQSADDITVPVTSTVQAIDAELSATSPVSAVENTAPPTISGQARVGKPLSATPGTWNPVVVDTTFQWLANDAPVAGATGTTYTPRIADVGKRISVRVTASADGLSPRTVPSAKTSAVPKPAVANGARPKISGKTVVGRKLRVKPGAWTPAPVALTYLWFADGVRVKKAKKSSFVLTAKQVGKRITVKVTASSAGYIPLTVATARTGKVKPKR